MEEYRRGAHSVYDIKYHLIWITKYRYKVLRGRVAERVGGRRGDYKTSLESCGSGIGVSI